MTTMPGFAGETLGRFVAESRWEDIDTALRHQAKRALLNFIGTAIGGARHPSVDRVAAVLAPFSGPASLTLFGRGERLDAMAAAVVNCIAGNHLDYDDTHLKTVIHPTATVAPPVLALAEERGLPGAAALHAFILGVEVACRLGNAVSPGHYARGNHITATCGVFGAAAACGKLLGLSAAEIWSALGIAASQSSGVVENLAGEAKNVGVGNAARNGILAALLAQRGYSAEPAAIDGKLGWARARGDEFRAEEITGGLGERWELASISYKPYPCGIVFHAVIDACLDLRRRMELAPDAIAAITVRGDQLLLDRGNRAVRTERDARISIHHSAAVALLRGRAGVREFEAAAVADPATAALRRKVRAELDAAIPAGGAAVTVETSDGRREAVRVDHARGSAERPLSDRDLEAKFRDNAALAGALARADAQIAALWAIEEAPSLGPLLRAFGADAG
ncbi:MAG TPA: MmgE/PrpD family protein [Stellaceae bacterium]|nr:MmgE/PrpD family protein [Stellaceae bacterium]